MKYHKETHYVSKDNMYNIYIYHYTTKGGNLKFHIEVYAELDYNNSGFCEMIACYNTSDNRLLRWLRHTNQFQEV